MSFWDTISGDAALAWKYGGFATGAGLLWWLSPSDSYNTAAEQQQEQALKNSFSNTPISQAIGGITTGLSTTMLIALAVGGLLLYKEFK